MKKKPSLSLDKIRRDGYGAQLASGSGKMWVAADMWRLHIWIGDLLIYTVKMPDALEGRVHFEAGGRKIFLGSTSFALREFSFKTGPPLESSLVAGLDPAEVGVAEQFEVSQATLSPDGAQLAIFCRFRPLKKEENRTSFKGPRARLLLLDGQNGQLQNILWQGRKARDYQAIAFGEGHVAAGGKTIKVWDRATGRRLARGRAHEANVRDLRYAAGDSRAVSAGDDGRVVVWGCDEWKPLKKWKAHRRGAQAADFLPGNPDIVASTGNDRQVKLWSLASKGKPKLLNATELEGDGRSLVFLADGSRLMVADNEGAIAFLDITE